MRKLNIKAAAITAVIMAASLSLYGCGKPAEGEVSMETLPENQQETAADESTAASDAEGSGTDASNASLEDMMAQIKANQDKISALNPVMPENRGTIKSINYKSLTFEATPEQEITDADVDSYLATNILPYVPIDANDDTVKDGDIVNIDYVGRIDGVEFDGGKAEGYNLTIGSGQFIDGFEDGLVGASNGETRVINVTFPEDYGNEELNGKEAEFTVDINNISRTCTLDEFDDEVAKALLGDDTMTASAYKKQIFDYLKQMAKLKAKGELYANALQAVVDASDMEPSDELIEWEIDAAMVNYDKTLQTQGMSLAYYLYMMGTDYDGFREQVREDAANAAKSTMARYAICDAEGFKVDDETIKLYLDEFGYTQEQFDSIVDDADKDDTVLWYLAGKTVVDNGTVNYKEAETE